MPFSEKELAALEVLLGRNTGYKHDASGTPNAQYFHGTQGILSMPGLDPKVFTTIVGLEPGLYNLLPKYPSVFDTPYYETLTGVQADVGDEPSAVCNDCKKSGLLKGCTLTTQFGRICRNTREVSLERVGQRVNRSDPMDLVLQNILSNDSMAPSGTPPNLSLTSELTKVLLEFGVSVDRELKQMLFQGNVANAVGTGYIPFNGMDLLITTGHTDAISSTSCPSLDSDIKSFNYQLITDTTPADIVEVMSAMYHFVKRLAETTGLMPVEWVWVMRPTLFHELSQIWPCRYSTYGCNVIDTTTGRVNVDAMQMVAERDKYRSAQYLPIEGKNMPVILDVGIDEQTNGDNANINPGEMASDIYLVPLKVMGGIPVTYMEYFQFSNPQFDEMNSFMGANARTTDNGMWLWTSARTYGCTLMQGVIRPRLILRTPQIAGRITDVRYNPLQHERTPFPGDDTYFVNGGDTYESNWPLGRQ